MRVALITFEYFPFIIGRSGAYAFSVLQDLENLCIFTGLLHRKGDIETCIDAHANLTKKYEILYGYLL